MDQESSFGWKNSIRHNLSLHKKFSRIQNTEISKSSWWIINSSVAKAKQVTPKILPFSSSSSFTTSCNENSNQSMDKLCSSSLNEKLSEHLDINEIICYEKTLNGGVLDFNKEMFNFIEHKQFITQ